MPEPINSVTLHTTIAKIGEKFEDVNWRKGPLGSESDKRSLGWFVQFTGSHESIKLFDTEPDPRWKSGAPIRITFAIWPDSND